MALPEETSKKIQELQTIEQNLQVMLQQKQSLDIELNEILNALSELDSSKEDDVYKIASGLMLKSSKHDLSKELTEKKELIQSRISSIEKQESSFSEKSESLRKEITKEISETKGEAK